MHLRALPLLLDGLLRGALVYAFLLIVGFVGLAAQMGLGGRAFVVLGILVPSTCAVAYLYAYSYRIRAPRRWTLPWWNLYNVVLGAIALLYFVSGMVMYGRTYLWYDVLGGMLFIAVLMLVAEALYAVLTTMRFSYRLAALGISAALLVATIWLVL